MAEIQAVLTQQTINVSFDRALYINAPLKLRIPASQNIESFRIVAVDTNGGLVYADHSNLNTLDKVIGVSLETVSAGEACVVLKNGDIEDQSFNFVGASLYVGVNGLLTTTPPSTGYLQKVGGVISTTRIYIEIHEPLKLEG